jgi:hypothetical protein
MCKVEGNERRFEEGKDDAVTRKQAANVQVSQVVEAGKLAIPTSINISYNT